MGMLLTLASPNETAVPPIPAFANIAACWSLFNFSPGVFAGAGMNFTGADGSEDISFTGSAPYPLNYAGINPANTPPLLVNTWADQNGNTNDLTQAAAARPVLDATTEFASFDGTQTGLAGAGVLYPDTNQSRVGTIYIVFKAGDLASGLTILLETGTGAADQAKRISIAMTAGVLTASVYDATAVVCLANSKSKTISDTNWHILAFTWNTDAAAGSAQTGLKVDNSTSGVTSPSSADVSALRMGFDVPNVGARNNAAERFFTGSMRHVICRTVQDDATTQTAWFDYLTYLQSVSH